jgi:hypothetical protein
MIRCEEDLKKLKQLEEEAEKIENKPPLVVDQSMLTLTEKNLLERPKLAFEREENKEFTVNTFLKMSELQVREYAKNQQQRISLFLIHT